MKKLLLAITAFAACLQLAAQYTFTETSGVYVPLSANADTVTDPNVFPTWDDEYVRIGLPFPVNCYGVWYDSCLVETNGELVLYNDWSGLEPWDVNDTLHAIMGFGEFLTMNGTGDLMSRGQNLSPILMEVTGNAGARIMKLEWRNAGFYEDTSATMTNFVNFQIWIHEITGHIEFHYGTAFIEYPSFGGSDGPIIGIAEYWMVPNVWDLQTGIYIGGTPAAEAPSPTYSGMDGYPGDSTIYFFSNLATVGIEHIAKNNFMLYPNPAADVCYLQMENNENTVMVTDASGRMVMENTTVNTTRYSLDVSAFAPGMYFVTVTSGNGSVTRSLIVE